MLSVPEVHRLADAIAPRYRALVLLATFGNMRWGELAGLRRRYLDLDGRRVRVVETVYEFGQLVTGLLTWSENTCEVSGLEEPKTRLVRHVLPGHRLECVAALHNYLALIITTSGRRGRKRFQ